MSNIRQNINNSNLLSQTNSSILKQILRNKSDKTGWSDTPPVTLAFDNGNLRFSITPTGDSFEYWIQGQKFIKYAAETVDIIDTEGIWYIYYLLGVLTASQTPWRITDDNKALVAIIHWDLTNQQEIGILYELHGYLMHASTHDWAHETIGTRYQDGLAISLGAGGDIGKVGLTGGEIHDEDIEIAITDGAGGGVFEQVLTLPAQIPVFYRSGSVAWRKYTAGDYPFYDNSGGDNIHYNLDTAGSWSSQAASGANKYIAMWVYGINEKNEPVIALMGQNESNTLAGARNDNTLDALSFGTLPFSEMKILHRLILRTDGSTIESLDLRATSNLPGGTFVPTSHGSLSGLGNDDHTLYLLADGTRAVSGPISHSNQDIDDVASILFDINDGAASEEGRLKWNAIDGTLEVGMPGGNVNLQIGQEELIRMKNVSGSTIVNGAAVRISGVDGNHPTVGLSDANDPATAGCIGLATEDILHNAFGYVTTSGMVRDINTLAWNVADRLFVSQTPGELTNVYPSGTDRIILVAIVIKDSETEGMVWVWPINQAHLSELSSVTIDSPADNEVLAFDSGGVIWINQTAAEAGLSDTSHNHNLNNLAEKNHNSLADKNGGVEFQHMSAAQIAALHATVVAGDLNHNSLANLNDGDVYEHLSAAQVVALHNVLTNLNQLATRNHSDLQNKNLEADIKHLTDAQIAALHAVAVAGDLNHNDLANIDAGDVKHLTAAQVAVLHPIATDFYTKAEVEAFFNIGVANRDEVSCHVQGATSNTAYNSGAGRLIRNSGGTDFSVLLVVPLKTTLGPLKLYIDDVRVAIKDADANDYLDNMILRGWVGVTQTDEENIATNTTTPTDLHYNLDGGWGGPFDMSAYDSVVIYIAIIATNANEFEISFLNVGFYYDT